MPRAHTWPLAEMLLSARLYILGHIPPIDTSSLTLLLFLLLHHKNLQKQVLFKVNEAINSLVSDRPTKERNSVMGDAALLSCPVELC